MPFSTLSLGPEEAAKQMDFFDVSESELMRDWDYVTFKENGRISSSAFWWRGED